MNNKTIEDIYKEYGWPWPKHGPSANDLLQKVRGWQHDDSIHALPIDIALQQLKELVMGALPEPINDTNPDSKSFGYDLGIEQAEANLNQLFSNRESV